MEVELPRLRTVPYRIFKNNAFFEIPITYYHMTMPFVYEGPAVAVLLDTCQRPDDLANWTKLLNFGSDILLKPARVGSSHNIAKVIVNRCDGAPATNSKSRGGFTQHDQNASLAGAVASKIEDGNSKAAIRILSSSGQTAHPSACLIIHSIHRIHI